MSIFGELDVSEFSGDPFKIDDGTYNLVCTSAKVSEKEGKYSLIIDWTIDEPSSQFDKNNIRQFLTLFPTKKKEDLDGEQIKSFNFTLLSLRRGFDLSEAQLATLQTEDLVGKNCWGEVVNNPGNGRTYANLRKLTNPRLAEEEGLNPSAADASSALGL